MSFRHLYLTMIEPIYGDDCQSHTCDLCWDPDYQDIIDAPLGTGFGVPLRPMYRQTGPEQDPAWGLVICQKCLMSGDYDAMQFEAQEAAS